MVHDQSCIAVYILANRPRGTLYIGVTSRFPFRIEEHRDGTLAGFTKKYGVTKLVWFEMHELMTAAIQREKSLKEWRRGWKVNLIERENPHWHDLYPALVAWDIPTHLRPDAGLILER